MVPLTVVGVAGGVVYPRSPLIVPAIVLVYVLERIPKLAASPRSGVVAAMVDQTKPKTIKPLSMLTMRNLEIFFMIIMC